MAVISNILKFKKKYVLGQVFLIDRRLSHIKLQMW